MQCSSERSVVAVGWRVHTVRAQLRQQAARHREAEGKRPLLRGSLAAAHTGSRPAGPAATQLLLGRRKHPESSVAGE